MNKPGVYKLWPVDQIFIKPCVLGQSFVGSLLYPLVFVLSMAAFTLQLLSSLVATETIWPAKPRVYIIWPFIEKVCQPMLCNYKVQCLKMAYISWRQFILAQKRPFFSCECPSTYFPTTFFNHAPTQAPLHICHPYCSASLLQ